jgi:hypothetical protein
MSKITQHLWRKNASERWLENSLLGGLLVWFRIFEKQIPDLFEICNEQKLTVAEAATSRWRLTFRRWWNVDLQGQMRELNNLLCIVALT